MELSDTKFDEESIGLPPRSTLNVSRTAKLGFVIRAIKRFDRPVGV